MQQFLKAGSLPGLEGINRLLGLWYMQKGASADGRSRLSQSSQRRLCGISKSHNCLLNCSVSGFPQTRSGWAAGFFARRAYVNERIIGLLLADGKSAEALQYAELAKARALQDVMAAGSSKAACRPVEPTELSQHPFRLAKEVAAVEYFLGSERAWVFLIHTLGHVSAYPLLRKNALPTASRDLVARIRLFLATVSRSSIYTRQENGDSMEEWKRCGSHVARRAARLLQRSCSQNQS